MASGTGTGTPNVAAAKRHWLAARDWLPALSVASLRGDLVAGITLAAYLLPAALGDASLANLPSEAGLYACLFSGLLFWLFCSSRHTAITVTSAISVLMGASLGGLAGGDPARFGALAAATALVVAAMGLAAWLLRAGVIVSFISETVMLGFKTGVGLFVASTQLPKLFDFWEAMGVFFGHLDQTNATAVLLGGVAIVLLALGKVYLPTKPVALAVVVGGIVAATLIDAGAAGVKLLGAVTARSSSSPPRRSPACSAPGCCAAC